MNCKTTATGNKTKIQA